MLYQEKDEVKVFLQNKLKLKTCITVSIKSLAVSHTQQAQVAVVSFKPRPECLVPCEEEEWEFGPNFWDDDPDDVTHITIDTHFRGVTVLYCPPDGIKHEVE
jgi:hypothetical protein